MHAEETKPSGRGPASQLAARPTLPFGMRGAHGGSVRAAVAPRLGMEETSAGKGRVSNTLCRTRPAFLREISLGTATLAWGE